MNDRSMLVTRIVGVTLIAFGALDLVGRIFGLSIQHYIWPFFIIVPGVLLFVRAVMVDDAYSEVFSRLGGVLVSLGLLLLYQEISDHWGSWAYAWALIGPTSVGVAGILYGKMKGREALVRESWSLVRIGLTMFAVGLIFFELVLNISGFGIGFIGWPILFIGLGVILLLRGLLGRRS